MDNADKRTFNRTKDYLEIQFIINVLFLLMYLVNMFNPIIITIQIVAFSLFITVIFINKFWTNHLREINKVVLFMVITLGLLGIASTTYFKFGTFYIFNAKQFELMNWNSSSRFELANDIYFDENYIYENDYIINFFDGNLDGKNHTIYGLKKPLFLTTSGTIENLNISDLDIHIIDTEMNRFGILAIVNSGRINQVHVSGTINANIAIGGIVAENQGLIEYSSFEGNIYSSANSIGGIASYSRGDIITSYAKGNITGSFGVGGLVGITNQGSIKNSYSNVNVSGEYYISGIVGQTGIDTELEHLIVCGNITSTNNGYAITSSNYNFPTMFLFLGVLDSVNYTVEAEVLFTQTQNFVIPLENDASNLTLNTNFYTNELGLDPTIWAFEFDGVTVLPYLIGNVEQ